MNTTIRGTWFDHETYMLENSDGTEKIKIPRHLLPSCANILANAATATSVYPVRLTLWERITGRYFGLYK